MLEAGFQGVGQRPRAARRAGLPAVEGWLHLSVAHHCQAAAPVAEQPGRATRCGSIWWLSSLSS